MERKVARQTKLKKTPLFVLMAMILLVIGIIATVFSLYVKEDSKIGLNSVDMMNTSSQLPSQLPSETASDNTPSEPESPPASSVPVQETKQVKVETVVPETIAANDEYFKDALFIGDSISKGLKLYGVLPESNVIADQNAGLDQIINDKDVYYVSASKKTTLWNAIDAKMPNPKKIYVLLGTNGIPGYENQRHIEFYRELVDKLKEKFPEAMIYIESVTPITKNSEYIRKSFSTDKINGFNMLVEEMAKEKGVYYLKVEDVLKDENGFLRADYAATDGMHMQKAGHQALYKYLKTHTVSADGYAQVPVQ